VASYSVNLKLQPISAPLIDGASGLATPQFYRWLGQVQLILNPEGADTVFTFQQQQVQNTDDIATIKAWNLKTGNGLQGGGALSSGLTIAALQDTGWTPATGTANKGAYAAYAGQTVSATYTQTEAQATDDAVKALAARVIALEEALRANGAIN
jgi:hypothetical protein